MQPLITPKLELDELVQKLWDEVVKGRKPLSPDGFLASFKKRINKTVETSTSYPFLLIALSRAFNDCKGDFDLFKQMVEGELSILFPKLQPDVPDCVNILSFLMHAAVYGRNCCPRKGLTLLDEFLDLKASDLKGIFLNNSDHMSKYQKLFPGRRSDIEQLANQTETEFNETKWKNLSEVLNLQANNICQFPGLEIIDIILESLDVEISTILSKSGAFVSKFEAQKKTLPPCVITLCRQFSENPVPAEKYQDFLRTITPADGGEEIILSYLAEMNGNLLTRCNVGKNSMSATFEKKLKVEKTKVQTAVEGCQIYLFAENFLNMMQSLYPDCQIGGVANWFMITETAQALVAGNFQSCDKILEGPDAAALLYLQLKSPQSTKASLDILFEKVATADPHLRAGNLFLELTQLTTRSVKVPATSTGKKLFETISASALLMRRYRFQALNHLMYREVHFMDPVISDTLCELRPPFLLDCDVIIQAELQNHQNWKDLVMAYNQNYFGKELNETLITTPVELIGNGPDPVEYLLLCSDLETALQEKGKEYYPRHLGLCKSLTRSSFLVRDELGIEMGETTIVNMPGNENRRRRSEMGTYNIWYTKHASKLLLKSSLTCPDFAETANCLINCDVVTPDTNIPLVPIYQAQTLAMMKAFELGRPIILRLKRIHIVSRNGEERKTCKIQSDVPIVETVLNAEYVVAGSEVLVYMPNRTTGRFELAINVPEDMPGMAVSAYSILDLTGRNPANNDPGFARVVDKNYYCENPHDYFEFIKTQDIVNLLNVCSANHPVFVPNAHKLNSPSEYFEIESGPYKNEIKCWKEIEKERKAKSKIQNQFIFLEELCGQKPGTLASASCTILFGQPINFCTEIKFEHFGQFYQVGEVLNFAHRQYKSGTIFETVTALKGSKTEVKPTKTIFRHDANMPFYSIHIYCSTIDAEIRRANLLHRTDVVGRFQEKDEMEGRAMQYLLGELKQAKSMQSEPQ